MHNSLLFKENPLLQQRGGDFMDGHYIIFSIFIYLVMFHEPQTWGPMVVEKMCVIFHIH
jgi:hypothetical protein